MSKVLSHIITIFLFLAVSVANSEIYAAYKTAKWKRIAVVENGVKKTKNDDAHYITIGNNVCYDSDKEGNATNSSNFLKYYKDENGMHCYKGNDYFGESSWFFNSDYSRLNVYSGDKVYVYVKETSGTATAREYVKPTNNGTTNNNNSGVVYIPMPSNNSSVLDDNSYKSSKPTRRTCPECNGTGKGVEEVVYGWTCLDEPDYYCSECSYRGRHSHVHHTCLTCNGKGWVDGYKY